MKTKHPKLKTTPPPPPRPLFSCGFFGQCTQTQTVSSPTTPNAPTPPQDLSSSSSSSSNTSQSFTQWKFPAPKEPPVIISDVQELFHVAELQVSSGESLKALHMLQHSLVPRATADEVVCPGVVMTEVVGFLNTCSKPATKVLLALCLVECNRRVAVEAGAVGKVIEALADLEGAAAERALAALELLCTVAEGAAEVRSHALSVPMIVEVMGKMGGRGREYAIGVLAVIFAEGIAVAPPEEVARAVVLGLQGDCTARGRRKGAHLLKMLQDTGRLDLTQQEHAGI